MATTSESLSDKDLQQLWEDTEDENVYNETENQYGSTIEEPKNIQATDRAFAKENPVANFALNMIPVVGAVGAPVVGALTSAGISIPASAGLTYMGANLGERLEEGLRNEIYRKKEDTLMSVEQIAQQGNEEGIYGAIADLTFGLGGKAVQKTVGKKVENMVLPYAQLDAFKKETTGITSKIINNKTIINEVEKLQEGINKEIDIVGKSLDDIANKGKALAENKFGKEYIDESVDNFSRRTEIKLNTMADKISKTYGKAIKTSFDRFRGKGEFKGKGLYDSVFNNKDEAGEVVGDKLIELSDATKTKALKLVQDISGSGDDIPAIIGAPEATKLTKYLNKIQNGEPLTIREANDVKIFFRDYTSSVAEGSNSELKGSLREQARGIVLGLDDTINQVVPELRGINKAYSELYSIYDVTKVLNKQVFKNSKEAEKAIIGQQYNVLSGAIKQGVNRGESIFSFTADKKFLEKALKNGDLNAFDFTSNMDGFMRQSRALRLTKDKNLIKLADEMDSSLVDLLKQSSNVGIQKKSLIQQIGKEKADLIEKEVYSNPEYIKYSKQFDNLKSNKSINEEIIGKTSRENKELGIRRDTYMNEMDKIKETVKMDSLLAFFLAGNAMADAFQSVGASRQTANVVRGIANWMTLAKWSPTALYTVQKEVDKFGNMIKVDRLTPSERKIAEAFYLKARNQLTRYGASVTGLTQNPSQKVNERFNPAPPEQETTNQNVLLE